MRVANGRPVGIWIIAVLVMVNGISSILEALTIAEFAATGVVGTLVSIILGLALVHRAYALWNFQRGAWLITIIILALRFVFGVVELFITSFSTVALIGLTLAAISILYLIQPSVRELFKN